MLELSFVIGMHSKADLTLHAVSLLWANITNHVAAGGLARVLIARFHRSRALNDSSHRRVNPKTNLPHDSDHTKER